LVFFVKEASIDKPLEEDLCRCHFTFVHDGAMSTDPPLVLKYQWFCGDLSLSNFIPIQDATDEVILLYLSLSIFFFFIFY
jgi:hypothetical protein